MELLMNCAHVIKVRFYVTNLKSLKNEKFSLQKSSIAIAHTLDSRFQFAHDLPLYKSGNLHCVKQDHNAASYRLGWHFRFVYCCDPNSQINFA